MKDLLYLALTATPNQVGSDADKVNNANKNTFFNDKLQPIINGFIGALGIIAVIVVIIGGIGYMTSAGDAGKVKKAKDTILYGIIGMIICVLAYAIVNFVISKL